MAWLQSNEKENCRVKEGDFLKRHVQCSQNLIGASAEECAPDEEESNENDGDLEDESNQQAENEGILNDNSTNRRKRKSAIGHSMDNFKLSIQHSPVNLYQKLIKDIFILV